MHLVLLGDSTLDNRSYVAADEPDVRAQVAAHLPAGSQVTLLAQDGNVIADVAQQLKRLPADTTHLLVSVGGNDLLLQFFDTFGQEANSVLEVMMRLTAVSQEFSADYNAILNAIAATQLPTALCTIYNPRFTTPEEQMMAVTALRTFNDCIIEHALMRGWPVLDMRQACAEDADFANPIEPSARGGNKIAAATVQLFTEHDFSKQRTQIFGKS